MLRVVTWMLNQFQKNIIWYWQCSYFSSLVTCYCLRQWGKPDRSFNAIDTLTQVEGRDLQGRHCLQWAAICMGWASLVFGHVNSARLFLRSALAEVYSSSLLAVAAVRDLFFFFFFSLTHVNGSVVTSYSYQVLSDSMWGLDHPHRWLETKRV